MKFRIVAIGIVGWISSVSAGAQDLPAGVDVQTRGPVHEAFAEPVQPRPEPTPVVPKAPPADVDEIPPDQKPAGDDVEWIPGYWAWDDEANDFLWVSGCWRVPPPGKTWVPGNWQAVDGGWQWTPGFWMNDDQTEVQYLPAPPPSVDEGPSSPAPNANSVYVPGCWVYVANTYRWRPGFWQPAYADWVWTPCHYVWTPAGYVYVHGYWDRPFEYRGLAFAPVRFAANLIVNRFRYVPSYAIAADFLIGSLFVRPNYGHYYFGDYFDAGYTRRGYRPWFDYRYGSATFDPLYTYYRHRYGDKQWESNLKAYYAGRASGSIPRPPRTLAEQVRRAESIARTADTPLSSAVRVTHRQNATAVVPLSQVSRIAATGLSALNPTAPARPAPAHTVKTEAVAPAAQQDVLKAIQRAREVGAHRRQAEGTNLQQGKVPVKPADPPRGVKLNIPKPPKPAVTPKPTPTPGRPPAPATPRGKVPDPPKFPPNIDRSIPKHEPPKPSHPPKKKKD